jgi:hypothetical protein
MQPIHPSPSFRALACGAALGLGAALLPPLAAAQGVPAPPVTSPAVQGLDVNADAGLTPGSNLDFTVRGTPGGRARVQVIGTPIDVPLREVAPGVYTGRTTLPRTSHLDGTAVLRTLLAVGPRTVIANHSFPVALLPREQQLAIAASAPLQPLQPQHVLRIDRFSVEPVDRLLPGTELRFALDGPPGAHATFELPNVAPNLPMQETTTGHYVGNYTLRRQDVLGSGPVTATLRSGDQWVSVPLDGPLIAGAGGASSVQMGAAAMMPLTLQIMSPLGESMIDGNGLLVQGRTAPGASVRVQVDLVPPHVPGRSAVAKSVAEQTVVADPNGNFAFSLGPQRVPPGTRYDVLLRASQGSQSTPEQRLVLYQRG